MRKTILRGALGAVAGVAAVGLLAGAAQAQNLTVVSWGGAYTKSQIEAYHNPFVAANPGVTIQSTDYNGGLAEVKAQVEANNVQWDIVDVELSDAIQGCNEGLFVPLDLSLLPPGSDGTPAKDDFIEGTLHECAVSTIIWTTIYAYDDTKFPGAKPTTMADFFDTQKFPGKRGMRRGAKVNLEFALIGDGVPAAQVYEVLATDEGVKRAFDKLSSIKSDIVWWEAGAQPPQLLADGEVVMTTAYNGRIFNAQVSENKPFTIVWDGQVWDLDLWAIPKGAPNADLAMKFLLFSTETAQLANQAAWISYAPARKSSIPLIPKHATAGIEMLPHMPTAPENFQNAVQNDFFFWADYGDELNERFNAWLAG